MNRTPYVYRIKNRITNEFYYGCKYAKNCHPETFWNEYFTSSGTIAEKLLEYAPDLWNTKIIKICKTPKEALALEGKLIKRTIKSKFSLNFRFQETYCGMNEIIVAKMLKKRNTPNEDGITTYQIGGRKCADTKINTILDNGVSLMQQTVEKTAKTRRERGDFELLSKQVIENGGIGYFHECEYCGKSVKGANFTRWHGENCKMNPNITPTILSERNTISSALGKGFVSAFSLIELKNIKVQKEEFDAHKGIKYVGATSVIAIELRYKLKEINAR